MPLLDLVEVGDCRILRWEAWNAPAGRWFFCYRARAGYRWLMGHAVVDEFATVSGPLFFSPPDQLGKIYNAGISLGHRRDPEMAVDQGWPPFCAGIPDSTSESRTDPESEILAALMTPPVFTSPAGAPDIHYQEGKLQGDVLEQWRFGAEVSCFATDVPLLPRQLLRLCAVGDTSLTLALTLGNRLPRLRTGMPGSLQSASESRLGALLTLAGGFKTTS
jgi:hypothetical protein